MYNKLYINKHI